MANDNETTLEYIIRLTAEGNGGQVTADQIAAARKEMAALQSSTAKQAGQAAGENFGSGFNEHLQRHLKVHLFNLLGGLADAPGLGRLAAGGGVAGIGAAIGFGVLEKGVETVVEKFKELHEKIESVAELGQVMRQGQFFSSESLHQLTEMAERMEDAKHKTNDWLKVMAELGRNGATADNMKAMSQDVAELAKLMGNDLQGAAHAMTQAMQGNFEELRRMNFAISENISQSEAMAAIHAQLPARMAAISNAAVSTVPNLRAMKEAGEAGAAGIEAIVKAADKASEHLAKMLSQIEKTKSDRLQVLDKEQEIELGQNEKAVAEHRMTQEQADVKALEIHKRYAGLKFNAEKDAIDKERAEREKARQAEVDSFTEAEGLVKERQGRVTAAGRIESAQTKVAKMEALLATLLKEQEYANRGVAEGELGGVEMSQAIDAKIAHTKAALANAREGVRDAIAAAPYGVDSAAKETKALDAAAAKFESAQERYTQKLQEQDEALGKLTQRLAQLNQLFGLETKSTTVKDETKLATDREAQRKHDEELAKEYAKKRIELRDRGFSDSQIDNALEVPKEIRGRHFSYDPLNDKVKFTDSIKNAQGAIQGMVQGVQDLTSTLIDAQQKLKDAASRARNGGQLIR